MNARWLLATALTAVFALMPSVFADVIVVDASGAGDATKVTTAVANSQDGDVIVVRAGTYLPFAELIYIQDKSLTIIADGPVTTGRIRIQSLGPDDTVVLRGLDVIVTPLGFGPALTILDSAGQVWVEDCTLTGEDGFFTIGTSPGEPGAHVANSAHVAFNRSTLNGGVGVDTFFPYAATPGRGGPALTVTDSSVSLHDCALVAGIGGDFVGFDGGLGPGGNGGHGLDGVNASVLVSGGSITGGAGGVGDELVPTAGFYQGGDAIHLEGTSALRELTGNVLTPGAGGPDGLGALGPAGVLRHVPVGSQLVYDAAPRSLAVSGPTREGALVEVDYAGEPHDLFALYVSLAPAAFPLNSGKGTWLLGFPLVGSYILGTADANGDVNLSVPLPDLGLGPEDAVLFFEQAFVLGPVDGKVLSAPSIHVVVDESL